MNSIEIDNPTCFSKASAVIIRLILINCLGTLILTEICAQQKEFPELTGPYLGQKPPGMIPEVFAPGVVSTGNHEHSSPVFSPDLSEIYWSTIIMDEGSFVARRTYYMKLTDNKWSEPEIPPFARKFICCDNPFISPDGKRLFFAACNTYPPDDFDLYYVDNNGNGWGDPIKFAEPVNSANVHDWQLTISNRGTIIYTSYCENAKYKWQLYSSMFKEGQFYHPEFLDINNLVLDWTPYISPDESYLIFSSSREDQIGNGDLYICFKQINGSWGKALNMGNKINTEEQERFPNVSPDGKYLFFNRKNRINGAASDSLGNGWGDIFWVDAKIIEELKQKDKY